MSVPVAITMALVSSVASLASIDGADGTLARHGMRPTRDSIDLVFFEKELNALDVTFDAIVLDTSSSLAGRVQASYLMPMSPKSVASILE